MENDDPLGSALREIEEETGLRETVALAAEGEPFAVEDQVLAKRWIVHPFLFDSETREARLDFEAVEGEWVSPTEILRRETVPQLWTSYRRVAPSLEAIGADREHGSAYLALRALEVLRDAAAAGRSWEECRLLAENLASARPTMVVLRNRIERVMREARESASTVELEGRAHAAITRGLDEDQASALAAAVLVSGRRVFTLSRSGTVREAFLAADPPPFVVVAESQPGGEGRQAAEELRRAGLEVALIADAEVAAAFSRLQLDAALVGADAILPSGGIVNKIGTRLAATAARHSRALFYAVASTDKLSIIESLPLEPLFEVVEGDFLTAIATERGTFPPWQIPQLLSGSL